MGIDTDGGEELHLIAWRQRCQIVLEPLHVYRRVCGNVAAAPVGKKQLSLRGVNRRKRDGRYRMLEAERKTWQRGHQGLKHEWKCPGDVIFQPQIRKNRRESAARVDGRVLAQAILQRDARAPSIPIRRIGRLGIVEIDLRCAGSEKACELAVWSDGDGQRSAMLCFVSPAIHFVTQAKLYREPAADFPRVLKVEIVGFAAHCGF